MNSKRNRTASFSLVEALLAMTILGIAVSSILTTFSTAIMMGKLAEDYSVASILMEEIHTYVRTNQLSPLDTNEGECNGYPGFTWAATYSFTEVSHLYQVDMRVQWKRGSQERSLKNTTYHFYKIPDTTTGSRTTGEPSA